MQSKAFFKLPAEVKDEIVCIRSPHPQRGWSRVGSEQTSKLRKENIINRNASELMDERVSRIPPYPSAPSISTVFMKVI